MRLLGISILAVFLFCFSCSEQNTSNVSPTPSTNLNDYRLVVDGKELTFTNQMLYLVIAFELYKTHVGQYPSNEAGLQALISKPEVLNGTGEWRGPYADTDKFFSDPWGRPLHYEISEKGMLDLRSLGRDGEMSGDDLTAQEMFPSVFRELQKISEVGPIPMHQNSMPPSPSQQ